MHFGLYLLESLKNHRQFASLVIVVMYFVLTFNIFFWPSLSLNPTIIPYICMYLTYAQKYTGMLALDLPIPGKVVDDSVITLRSGALYVKKH